MVYIKLSLLILSLSLILLLLFFILSKDTRNDTIKTEYISLEKFNEIFGGNIIKLPKNMISVGFNDNIVYIYCDDEANYSYKFRVFIDYFKENIISSLNKSKFYFVFCYYDGYLERNRVYKSCTLTPFIPKKDEYMNSTEIILKDNSTYPILHDNKTIFAYCRHYNDLNTICIPDHYCYSTNGYIDLFKYVDRFRIDFDEKKNMCVWRGNLENGTNENFFEPENKNGMNQRKYFAYLYKKGNFTEKMEYSENQMAISEQMKYKYILDIDGYTNAWDATAWKLYSGSVLLKVESIWEQWFYGDLLEWVHYVPVKNDFSDLNEKIEWCMSNDEKCRQMAKNAYELAIRVYDMKNMRNDIIKKMNMYL